MTFNRKNHWEQVYQNKSPLEVSWYQTKPELSLSLIHRTGIDHDGAIIDVGGGASVLVDCLHKEGFRKLAVLDISAAALAAAKQRLAEGADNIEWFESDVTEFEAPHTYDLWHDRAVFHFLTEAKDRRKYVEVLSDTLTTGGYLILASFAIGGPEKCSGLDIVQYDADKLMRELGPGFELIHEDGEMHMTPANKTQKFGYFLFQKI